MFMSQVFFILDYACNVTKREKGGRKKNLYETKAGWAFIDGLEQARAKGLVCIVFRQIDLVKAKKSY